ncbi:MAG: glucosaminidase domain-containing protein, partial [Gammaproteobacteria bacterium]
RSAVNSTLEYDRGIPVRQHARFRSYRDLAAGFQDYVRFIRDNPRYSEALKTSNPGEYIQALQDAGYATDPDYARKVLTIFKQNGFSELVPERA